MQKKIDCHVGALNYKEKAGVTSPCLKHAFNTIEWAEFKAFFPFLPPHQKPLKM